MELDPGRESFVSERLEKLRISAARVALFDELVDYYLDGVCTLEQSLIQFMHDAHESGIGYGS